MRDEKILLCDDSALARRSMTELLQKLDFQNIVQVADGEAAIEAYKNENPAIVFLDIVMPKKDGIQVVEEIMAYDKDAKIVMFSSVGTQDNLRKTLEKGACDFVQKPARPEDVENILSKLIGG